MKKIFWIVMAICAVMLTVILTGCEKSAGNDLVKLPKNGSNTLSMYCYNGEKTFWGHLFDDDAASGILESLAAVSVERAEDWSPADVSFPVYGVKFGLGDDGFEAAWSNGYWITQTGEAYSFDYDFANLWEDYDWDGAENQWSTAAILPCSYYFCRDENGWIADYLPPAGNLPAMPETLTASVSKLDGDVLTVEFTNRGEENCFFGELFELQAQLDGEWYQMPRLPGDWIYAAIARLVMPQQTLGHDYDLSCYGTLPEGNYRIITDDFSAEFYLTASGKLANFSDSEPNTANTAFEEVVLPEKVTAAALKLEGNMLTVKLRNDSREDFHYNESYDIQSLVNGEWQEILAPADRKLVASEYVVKRFSTFEHTYDLSSYGELPDGKYRLVTEKFSADFYIDNSKETTYFYQDENGEWIAEALEAADAPPAMDGISAIVAAQDENSLTVRLTNWGYKYGDEDFRYGAPYHVEVFLGKRWYVVPTKDIDFGFFMPLYGISNGETKELFYDFSMYDTFPEGRYRVVNDGGFWAEFTAGETITPQNDLANDAVKSVTISYYDEYIDGSNSVIMEYIDKDLEISKILSIISAEPAEKVDNWSGSMIKAPIFGISAADARGWVFEGAWSNGYWINQNGEAYRLDFDIEQIKRRIVQYEGSKTTHKNGSIAWLPCGTHLCKDENGWIADHMEPAAELSEPPENITAEITELTSESVTIRYTNNGDTKWVYGSDCRVDVLIDGEWYKVPTKPGNWVSNCIAYNLPAGESREEKYYFEEYESFPIGTYRINTNDLIIEFHI